MIHSVGKVPRHIAIIMDGNGRWAISRGHSRFFGHVKGARVAKSIVEYCSKIEISQLTLYTFSEENWSRPEQEVEFLWRLLLRYMSRQRDSLMENNIKFYCIGQMDRLPRRVFRAVTDTIQATAGNTGMALTLALSYGGRQEILRAIKGIVDLARDKKIKSSDITENFISSKLQTTHLDNPDLLIRTSGEMRLSNFLTWQSVYSELYFTNVLWPDFKPANMDQALYSFARRKRRFGTIHFSQDPPKPPNSPQEEILWSL